MFTLRCYNFNNNNSVMCFLQITVKLSWSYIPYNASTSEDALLLSSWLTGTAFTYKMKPVDSSVQIISRQDFNSTRKHRDCSCVKIMHSLSRMDTNVFVSPESCGVEWLPAYLIVSSNNVDTLLKRCLIVWKYGMHNATRLWRKWPALNDS
jgi:hypothetical protein